MGLLLFSRECPRYFVQSFHVLLARFNFNQTWYKSSLGKWKSSGLGLIQRGDKHKKAKIGWGHLKIFSRTTGPKKLKFI
jgi:hypothetical protein